MIARADVAVGITSQSDVPIGWAEILAHMSSMLSSAGLSHSILHGRLEDDLIFRALDTGARYILLIRPGLMPYSASTGGYDPAAPIYMIKERYPMVSALVVKEGKPAVYSRSPEGYARVSMTVKEMTGIKATAAAVDPDFLLIDSRALRRIGPPWFGKGNGADPFAFFRKANEANFFVLVNGTIVAMGGGA